MNYQELQDVVTKGLHRDDLTGDYDAFFRFAHADITNQIEFPAADQFTAIAASAGLPVEVGNIYRYPLPANCETVESVFYDGQSGSKSMTADQLVSDYRKAGGAHPVHAIRGFEIWTVGNPDLHVWYEGGPAFFSSPAATNEVATAYPHCYTYGALMHACRQIQDPEEEAANLAQFDHAVEIAKERMRTLKTGDRPAIRSGYMWQGDRGNVNAN